MPNDRRRLKEGEPDVDPLVDTPANPFDIGGRDRIAGQVPGLLDTPADLPDFEDDGLSMDWPEEIFCPPPLGMGEEQDAE